MLKLAFSAIRATVVLAVITGLVFPLVMTGLSQVLFPWRANGSLIRQNGKVIGSELIGQSFLHPKYFHPRPSAAGSGYAGESSGASNLSQTSKKLLYGDSGFAGIQQLTQIYRTENGLDSSASVPVDAVTRSASGLDPDISLPNALLQADRVAKARSLTRAQVLSLVQQLMEQRSLGFLGEPHVNVLKLNLALDRL